MEIGGVISAIFIGAIIGALGRLVLPGRQKIGMILTILLGIIAALVGTYIARLLGVSDTRGFDWIELIIQIACAAGAVALVSAIMAGRTRV